MIQPTMHVRVPSSEQELIATHNILSRVFGTLPPEEDQATHALAWRDRRAAWNELMPSTTRSAFRDKICLGTYQLDERHLWLGNAPIRVGCIGAVATHPEYRNQGVASVLMRDAEEVARQQGLGFLLLHGIGNFYQRFGYTNVADLITHQIEIKHISTLPVSGCSVRQASTGDVDALLRLYTRHQNCFSRTHALQRELLRHDLPIVAVDRHGLLCGYMLQPNTADLSQVLEVAADTWDATVALLQYHGQLVQAATEPSSTLAWSVAQQSQTYYLLAEHIPLKSTIQSIPNAEWMARTASIPDLFAALLPGWQDSRDIHPAAVRWVIDDIQVGIRNDHGTLSCGQVASDAPTIRLSQAIFTRMAFRYRPVAWANRQPGQEIPTQLFRLVERLFASNSLFVPKSDGF